MKNPHEDEIRELLDRMSTLTGISKKELENRFGSIVVSHEPPKSKSRRKKTIIKPEDSSALFVEEDAPIVQIVSSTSYKDIFDAYKEFSIFNERKDIRSSNYSNSLTHEEEPIVVSKKDRASFPSTKELISFRETFWVNDSHCKVQLHGSIKKNTSLEILQYLTYLCQIYEKALLLELLCAFILQYPSYFICIIDSKKQFRPKNAAHITKSSESNEIAKFFRVFDSSSSPNILVSTKDEDGLTSLWEYGRIETLKIVQFSQNSPINIIVDGLLKIITLLFDAGLEREARQLEIETKRMEIELKRKSAIKSDIQLTKEYAGLTHEIAHTMELIETTKSHGIKRYLSQSLSVLLASQSKIRVDMGIELDYKPFTVDA